MKKSTRVILYTSFGFISIGLGLGILGFSMGASTNVSLTNKGIQIGSVKSEESYQFEETNLQPFSSIDVSLTKSDLIIIQGDSYGIKHSSTGTSRIPIYSIEDGVLEITETSSDSTDLLYIMNLNFSPDPDYKNYTTIYIPENADITDINITIGNNTINIENLILDSAMLVSRRGDIILTDCEIDSLEAITTHGNISMSDISSNTMSVENNGGSIFLNECTVEDIVSSAVHGVISLNGTFSNTINLYNEGGDIILDNRLPQELFQLTLSSRHGNIIVGDTATSEGTLNLAGGPATIQADSNNGDIILSFSDN